MKKIILCGYMASGKTTVARLLSRALGFDYKDLDEEIERETGKSIPEIFSGEGELKFRRLEHDALKNIVESGNAFVLSLGGGTPCYANNHLFLQREDVVSIYLKAGIKELAGRIKAQGMPRPLLDGLKDEELEEFIAKHLFDRSFYYHQAKHVVTMDNKTPENIVNEIVSLL